MADGLPEGLVTNSEAITGDIQGVDHIDAEDLAHLWRVYTTNRNLLANDVGRRLENFFWRIWSNGRIRENIRGTQIAQLFVAISEGDVVIRTTPTSSPRASRILPSFHGVDRRSSSPTPAAGSVGEPELAGIDERLERRPGAVRADNITTQISQPPTIEEEKGRRRGSSRPPPILKKPRTESTAQQSKTARILTPTWKTPHQGSHDYPSAPQASSSRSFNPHPTEDTNPPSASPTTPPFTAPKPAKKKPTFTASSSSTKRRPTLPHRKSSHSSSSTNASKAPSPRLAAQSTHSPPPPLPSFSTTTHDDDDHSALAPSPPPHAHAPPPPPKHHRPTSRSASPISSTPFHRPSRDHLPTHSSSSSSPQPSSSTQPTPRAGAPQDWLVDPHFRAKFADRTRVAPARGTVAPQGVQARGRFELGKEAEDEEEDEEEEEAGEEEAEHAEEEHAVKEDGDEETPLPLPRTTSQLTMLLARDRRTERVGARAQRRGGGRRGGGGAGAGAG
ncbi:hypothetical protein MMC27_008783 [Xylographa pallens]|nr:hypothetical protein [Xylographa pallens]